MTPIKMLAGLSSCVCLYLGIFVEIADGLVGVPAECWPMVGGGATVSIVPAYLYVCVSPSLLCVSLKHVY